MLPLARIGDPLTHDLLAPCGAIGPPLAGKPPMVLVEGLPAAFLGCSAACSGLTSAGPAHPPVPGPPPPIVAGSSVLIGGLPAARWAPSADVGGCGALLGDPKLAALRTVFVGLT